MPLTQFATPLSPDAPAGPDPHDIVIESAGSEPRTVAYMIEEAERLVESSPPTTVFGAKTPADPPWQRVRDLCTESLQRCRHLNAARLLTVSELELRGIEGLAEGLALIASLFANMWPSVHPGPAAISRQAGRRRRLMDELSQPYSKPGDRLYFRDRIANVPLVPSQSALALSSWLKAEGVFPVMPDVGQTEEAAKAVQRQEFEAARQRATPDELNATLTQLDSCLKSIEAIEQAFLTAPLQPNEERQVTDLSDLKETLATCKKSIASTAGASQNIGNSNKHLTHSAGGVPTGIGVDWSTFSITTDAQARLALKAIRSYIEGSDRSSPAPLVLEYASRLIGVSYEDVQLLIPHGTYQQIRENIDRASAPKG